MTLHDPPMGGCSTSTAHFAHLDAGDPRCQNDRESWSDEPWPHSTPTLRMLGRERTLIANGDYSHMILIDDGGGFDPTPEDLFMIIDELARRLGAITKLVR